MNPDHMIEMAWRLATGEAGGRRGRPRQADLRLAVRTAYYALFHALARSCANALAGATPATRDQAAWRRAYRALEHGYAKNQCLNQSAMSDFPEDIQSFGSLFALMQDERHSADYDPIRPFVRLDVIELVETTDDALSGFRNASPSDRRRFAIYVLLRNR